MLTPGDAGYSGATKHSNNTGELTALLRAVQQESAQADDASVHFCVDSVYAINVATGKWILRCENRELGRRLAHAMAALRVRRGFKRVVLRHVRAHAKNVGNETADALAKAAMRDGDFGDDGARVLQFARATFRDGGVAAGPPGVCDDVGGPSQQHDQRRQELGQDRDG